jgi:phosphoglucan, water dikinase
LQDNTLRLKASLERIERLTTGFVDGHLDAFADRALRLGAALGVSGEVQTIFTEAEIRASVAFQLSKLNSMLLRACREILGSGDFDAIVLGSAVGELVEIQAIEPGMQLAEGRPCVLLVDEATGDEEVRLLDLHV